MTASAPAQSAEARRTAIRLLIRRERIATQEELRARLESAGFEVTQATLSRDLAKLGARRVVLHGGGTAYELTESPLPAADPAVLLTEMSDLVVAIEDNGALVVITTRAGAASAVASAIDASRLPESLGSLAGDDCIFLAPAKGHPAERVAERLRTLFHRG